MSGQTLCILGCGNLSPQNQPIKPLSNHTQGNLGTPILRALLNAPSDSDSPANFSHYIACIQSETSESRLKTAFSAHLTSGKLSISRGANIPAVQKADVIILGVDPSGVASTLSEPGLAAALAGKLLISVVAGWTREAISALVNPPDATNTNETDEKEKENKKTVHVLRTLPNIATLVSHSLTAIETPPPNFPPAYLTLTTSLFSLTGRALPVPPALMPATTAISGSTPAFFSIIADALIDASVAVGMPRAMARAQIYQSMLGTAAMLKSGVEPGELRDMGTSPEGCTIAGVMVLEEKGVRGGIGRALREAVTVAREMGREGGGGHVGDTRR